MRNAAMRFGICLSLWTKQDQSSQSPIRSLPSAHPAQGMTADQVEQSFVQAANVIKIGGVISDKQKGLISSLGKEVADGDIQPIIQELFEKTNLNTLTTKEGSELIKHLMGMRKSEPAF